MTQRKRPFENIVGKGENAGNQNFSPSTIFFTLPYTHFCFSVPFDLLSANALNLDWSKILSSGKEVTVNPLPHDTAFDALKIYNCGKLCEKRRNYL